MLRTTVLLPVAAWDCHCLHCQGPIPQGVVSGLCVECYLDEVYSGGEFDLPVEEHRCPWCLRPFEDCDCPADDGIPLGVPCPGEEFVPF